MAKLVETPKHLIRDTLRVQTRDIHQQLHEHSHFVALFDGSVTFDQYRDLMKTFHGFYAPMERAIDRVSSDLPSDSHVFSYTGRTDLIEKDLRHLGFSREEIDHNAICQPIADVVTPATLPGLLYVIEGSTLGATQIDRAVQKFLSSDNPDGRRFWAWSRANSKTRWTAINDYLDNCDTSPASQEAIVAGANETFQALSDWLEPLDRSQTKMHAARQ